MYKILIVVTLVVLSSCSEPLVSDPSIQVKDGFVVEKLYSPTAKENGSWVSITKDDKGRLITSDQYGSLYYVDAPKIGSKDSVVVTPFPLEMGNAHGLLWAYNSLYVMKNANNGKESGLYRITDSNNDGELDKISFLHQFIGQGEHGPHGIVLGPDGLLYMSGGNHTSLPETFNSVQKPIWDEDQLLGLIKDPRGHANNVKAPGGWVARAEKDGSNFTVIATGFRNAYDLVFNAEGELFTFDSDMEWDMGSPWYRPIRVCHITQGSEFGWRTGSGKWPSYYPDNVGSVVDIGQGSPTGMVSGNDLNFPEPYKSGMFVFDWSFGTMYFVSMKEEGASYTGTSEEFLSGAPLPLTDGVAGDDGALYFVTGGRRLESGLYRVSHRDASASTKVAGTISEAQERRKKLESYAIGEKADMDFLWKSLGDQDSRISYAARVSLEYQDEQLVVDRFAAEKNVDILIQTGIALARTGEQDNKAIVLDKLMTLSFDTMNTQQQINYIRAIDLLFIRGDFDAQSKKVVSEKLGESYPSKDNTINRELVQLLVYVDDPMVVDKTLGLITNLNTTNKAPVLNSEVTGRSDQYGKTVEQMKKNTPPSELMHYVNALSKAKAGWNASNREVYFKKFATLFAANGGESYGGFLLKMREAALVNVPKAIQDELIALSGEELAQVNASDLSNLPKPKGPGKNWKVAEVLAIDGIGETGNLENGQKMYQSVLCATCHTVNNEGGSIGPNLTQVATRFSVKDIATAIINPDAVVSDQYEAVEITLNNDRQHWGRIVSENENEVFLNTNPLSAKQQLKIAKKDIKDQKVSQRSIMMPSLINRLNEAEVKDLFYFLAQQAKSK
ncbi:c-type cytochrome [Cellulophaga sp. F20128]|uniref:c-type cytochrome n=1 Tax=Cellulophaga sp. F20128 TaxID=2926413 RepID=UPI001FF2C4E6|nr:c-type cytochrome [Cellulophaga sp. F20128]MCK0155932.1 c-type cytochrome [Cellulophaga sp. F20128]